MPLHVLPRDAQGPFHVQHVYDGDTFTLSDQGRRVRVIGIDTPEVKIKAPYSEDAKALAKRLIEKKDVYLQYSDEKHDRYGRELAIVYVRVPTSANGEAAFVCLNEEMLLAGFAYYYAPSRIPLENTLLAAQGEARVAKRGLWSNFSDYEAFRTANGRAFHSKDCDSIKNVKRLTRIMASEGFAQGLTPCRTCLNPDGNGNNHTGLTPAASQPPYTNNNNNHRPPQHHDNGPQQPFHGQPSHSDDHHHKKKTKGFHCCVVQ